MQDASSPPWGRVLFNAFYATFVLALAVILFVRFLQTSQIGVNGKATFEKVLNGTAYRPYIYRQLLPIVATGLAPYVDGRWALRLGRQTEAVLGERFFRAQLNGRIFPRQVILILAIMYVSFAGFAATMGFFVRDLGYSRPVTYLMPVAALLATTINFNFGYMYDFTQLLLFTAGLWLMHRRAWAAYLLVFALGCINKETTVFLVLIFAIYYWHRLPSRAYLTVAGAQAVIFVLIQSALRYRFRNNPGEALEWHLPDQIAGYQRIFTDSPWLLALWAIALTVIAGLVIWRWKHKPAFIRYALSPLPILVLLWLLWGWPLEIRNLMEMLPVVLILMLPSPSLPAIQLRGNECMPELERNHAKPAHETVRRGPDGL